MSEIEKNYTPESIEKKWYESWETEGYFKASNNGGKPYSIMLPPPNVTGTLHMGHGFQHTLMDILIRYHRMMGHDTLWQPGTDHAGIATQMVVERQLAAKNISRYDLGREKFIAKIWEWKEKSGTTITKQMRRLGNSVDWDRDRFTMDEGLSQAVKEQFISLYEQGMVYRGKRLVNWDPSLLTAVSDLEVISDEENGHLWYIDYPLDDNSEYLRIATTRPETMLGDTAIAINPNDGRYKHLKGKCVRVPLSDRIIPIITDEYVDKDFGTGCVKITPAHDFNDYEVGLRHNLEIINIFTDDARINNIVPKKYVGLDRFEARKIIISDLEKLGLLNEVKEHKLKIPRSDRTGTIIEPYLTEQWFIKMKDIAKPAIDVVKSGDIKFIPDNWKNTYYSWMNDIQDWCISRQLWWGHRIPAWYDDNNNIYVGENETDVRSKYQLSDLVILKQDNDVFDTWFSSAIWPFSTLGWPQCTDELARYYPSSVLVTGFDIIFFWVARMIMMGIKFMGEVPFKDIYITGLIRDSEGQKMSKSKGNVLDPVDLIDGISLEELVNKRTSGLMQPSMKSKIEKQTRKQFPNGIESYGTDALRFTFAALASTSRDICFDVSRMEGYRNFCNKLWNASRFILMNMDGYKPVQIEKDKLCVTDKWIWSKLNHITSEIHNNMANYRFDLVAQSIYDFVWNTYCGWYLEFAKARLINATPQEKLSIKHTLINVLDNILRLSHPIIPFITEEIYRQISDYVISNKKSIMINQYPIYRIERKNENAEKVIYWLKKIISSIRVLRSEVNIKPSQKVNIILKNISSEEKNNLDSIESLIKSLAKVSKINYVSDDYQMPISAVSLVNNLEIHMPLSGLVNIDEEISRLNKELLKLEGEIIRIQKKLSNERFVSNAPQNVVEKEKSKYEGFEVSKLKLKKQLTKISSLSSKTQD